DFALARDYLSKGLLTRAMAEVRRVAAAGGDPIDEALLTGEIFRLQGLDGEALDRFDIALERLGTDGWTDRHERAHLGRGWSLLARGNAERALESASTVHAAGGDTIE